MTTSTTLTFFTSDWHFGHVNILQMCPQRYAFLGLAPDATVGDMNEALVKLWNRQVRADDVVYLLGDFCMGQVEESLKFASRLQGRKYLILGNHDRPHPCFSKTPEKAAYWTAKYFAAGFESLLLRETAHIEGQEYLLCHFPYSGDHTEKVRYQEYRPSDEGKRLIHGHVHDAWTFREGMLNVGIDAWDGKLLSAEDISRLSWRTP
jgi:calcineurin-like phosphoesterase family protein